MLQSGMIGMFFIRGKLYLVFYFTYKILILFIYKDWMNKGLPSIVHLMDGNGNLLSHTYFKIKFNLNCSYTPYSLVVKTIPLALMNLSKGMLKYSALIPISVNFFFIEHYNFIDHSCNNNILRLLITKGYFLFLLEEFFKRGHYQS